MHGNIFIKNFPYSSKMGEAIMKGSKGFRANSRYKLKEGRFKIADSLQDFKPGNSVRIKLNPNIHRGMPHPKYQGAFGKILGKKGNSFILEIKNGNKLKQIISRPEHLARAG